MNTSNSRNDEEIESVLAYMDKFTVIYPTIREHMERIKECHQSVKYSSVPDCLFLMGPSRSGKTETIKKYISLASLEKSAGNILYCQIPSSGRTGAVATALLDLLEDPFYDKGSITNRTYRFEKLAQKSNLEMIVLDEVQHIVDRDTSSYIRETADWFKNLIEELHIPIIFVGLENAQKILDINEQLKGRVTNICHIRPFKFNSDFRKLLYSFDKALVQVKLGPSDLGEENMAARIYTATGGLIGYVKLIIRDATYIAMRNNYNLLSLPVFEETFNKKTYASYGKNPFSKGFDVEEYVQIYRHESNYSNSIGVNRRMSRKCD